MITADYLSDSLDNGASNQFNAGAAFFPLMKVVKATVRNTRACDGTEIGIRSNVFQRLNGLCNFQTIPSPEQLKTLRGNGFPDLRNDQRLHRPRLGLHNLSASCWS